MQVSVLKFGGSSLANTNKIKQVAQIVIKHANSGPVLVVLSAMYGETNKLMNLAYAMSDKPEPRELDLLLSSGEQVSASLLSMHLNAKNIPARALTAAQIKLSGIGQFQFARVKSLDCSIINAHLDSGIIPVITGFQAVLPCGNVATMERGGSDTSAVAIAAALRARCYIYSDVDGVYSSDPNAVDNVVHMPEITYQDMLAFSAVGAKVLQVRSIQLAQKYQVELILRSTFSSNRETKVKNLEGAMSRFFGVAITKERYIIKIFEPSNLNKLSELNINFDDVSLCDGYLEVVLEAQYLPVIKSIISGQIKISPLLSKVSLVGLGDQNKARLLNSALSYLQSNLAITSYQFDLHSISLWVVDCDTNKLANLMHKFASDLVTV